VVDAALYEKIQQLKGLLAHSIPNASYVELLEYLVDEALPRVQKRKGILPAGGAKPEQNAQVTAAAAVGGGGISALPQSLNSSGPPLEAKLKQLPAGRRVALPAAAKRAVGARSGGRCEYVYQGKRCDSRYQLEIDHRVPLVAGGGHEVSQLRHLCRQHNLQQYQAWFEMGGSSGGVVGLTLADPGMG
jgi:hypothetical protein